MAHKLFRLTIAAAILLGALPLYANTTQQAVDNFVTDILSQRRIPSVADYYHYYAPANEDENEELRLAYHTCDKKGWAPQSESEECKKLVFRRQHYHMENDHTPSLYLHWLRQKLPLNPVVRIIRASTISENGEKYQQIQTQLNDIMVNFRRPLAKEKNEQILYISEINGIRVKEMLELALMISEEPKNKMNQQEETNPNTLPGDPGLISPF